jgi:hypothetical protein
MAPQHSAPTTHPSPATIPDHQKQPSTITKDQIPKQQEHNPNHHTNGQNHATKNLLASIKNLFTLSINGDACRPRSEGGF